METLSTDTRRLKVLLCGYGHLGLALLQGLLSLPDWCEVAGVFRWTARPGGQAFWEPVEDDFKALVAQAGLRDIVCPGMNSFEFIQLLQEIRPHVVLVGSWGEILKAHVLEFPGVILVNCHPSLLPAHRGANPYASVILQQEEETGVTFHRMAAGIDTGAILLQRAVPLSREETGDSVRVKCVVAAYEMVPDLIGQLRDHLLLGHPLLERPQDETAKSYFGQLKQESGLLDWSQSPEALSRQIRALYPWVVCYSRLQGRWPVLFYHSRFVLEGAAPAKAVAPGTIVRFDWRTGFVQVALSEPGWLLQVEQYQVALSDRFLIPPWLVRLFAFVLLRPGLRFWNAG
ncbi:methionyl-tRNA formyltransferase [Vampirovibrio chlorellavorus]|uniref:methionyl-tRNA formyltransferase n=1 Tax=Vampirovibrio chlorellavorus TaxID=758823 RepID=UPI0026EAC8FF|nr:formyltransferase family protein [Vampirovibrio chlorellavorus]